MVGKREMAEDPDREYKALKQNNNNLARALTEERLLCKQYIDERNLLQKKLNTAMIMNMRYEKIFNQLSLLSKHALPNCITLTNNISEIMQLCKDGINVPNTVSKIKVAKEYNNEKSSPWSSGDKYASPVLSNKTHAVKPMVSGHVILHPTINLWRINDTDSDDRRNIEPEYQSVNDNTPNATQSNNLSNNNTENEHLDVEELRTLLPNRTPIRGLTADSLIQDYHAVEGSEYNSSLSQKETTHNSSQGSLNSKTSRLETVDELSEESMNDDSDNLNVDSNLLKEARILINPLPVHDTNTISKRKKLIEKNLHYDPLEGPSTLLDDAGYLRECNNYVSKPRAVAKRIYVESDSDTNSEDSSHENKKKNKKRFVTKRKAPAEKNNHFVSSNIIDDDYEVKNSNQHKKRKNDNENTIMYNQPVVILTQLSEDLVSKQNENESNSTVSNEMEDEKDIVSAQKIKNEVKKKSLISSVRYGEDRPRRTVEKQSYKELSLRCKLRREN